MYPLRFEPIYRDYLWGGRRLAAVLGKPIPENRTVAESWELVDRGDDQSRVLAGPLQGKTLGELVRSHGGELLGRHADTLPANGRFPLLFKFLDANQKLSVQVHPDDAMAATLDPPDLGKTEAWVILAAESGSVVYAGLKRGFDRAALEREVARGATELCLHRIEPQAGDCIFIPAGVVHALGEGLLVAEIQQASDTTFRLFDWNRTGPDGQPRALHVDRALAAIDYDYGPVHRQTPRPAAHERAEQLAACDKFVLNRWKISEPVFIGGDERFHILAATSGEATLADDPLNRPLAKGETALLPAACGAVEVTPRGEVEFLEMYLP